jgi:hypothetical protein
MSYHGSTYRFKLPSTICHGDHNTPKRCTICELTYCILYNLSPVISLFPHKRRRIFIRNICLGLPNLIVVFVKIMIIDFY